jgi:hypothetical protein
MALPKLDNTQLEKQGIEVLAKLDLMHTDIVDKIDKLSQETTLQQLLIFTAQSAVNLYNIAGKMDAQVTSFRETKKVLEENLPQMRPPAMDEGAQIEKQREDQKPKEKEKPKEKKEKSFWEKLGEFFEKVLIPLLVGFVIGLSKAFGLLETGIGKLVTLFAILYVALSGFRKAINKAVGGLFTKAKDFLMGKKPELPGTGGIAAPGGAAPGAPEAPGKGPATPKGPSGLDKFLQGAQKIGKSIKELFVGIADTVSKVLGKLADGIKQFISKIGQGLKSLLTSLAKGIESFGTAKVLKGAAALVVVSGALYIAAKAFKQFADVDWAGVAKGLVGITGLVLVMKLLEKGTVSMIKGAAALTIMSGALFLAGKAFQQFANVDWKALGVAALGIIGLTAAVVGLGMVLPMVIAGSAALGVMSVALLAFGAALNVVGAALPAFSDFLTSVGKLNGAQLLGAAAGITAVGLALAGLGATSVIGAIGNFISSLFGKNDPIEKLIRLGEASTEINKLPDSLKALQKLSNFEVSKNFMQNVDILAAGLRKIADAAKGFEKTGDALTALAKIAEALNRPAPGAAGQPAGGAAGPQPAPGPAAQPAAKPAGGSNGVYSKEDIAAAERNLAVAEKSGGKAAISAARSRLENMKSQNKMAEAGGPPQQGAVPSAQPAQGNVLDRTAAAAVRGATPPAPVQAVGPYSEADIQKQRDLAGKMPEGSAGRNAAEAQLQKMESANKVAAATAQATPEQRAAVAEGRRVEPVQTTPPGQQIMTDSQRVAAADSAAAGQGRGNAIVNAPTTNVNNGQTNNFATRPSATPTFGAALSRGEQRVSAF